MFKFFSDTRFIGKQLIYLPKCHSTNDIAAELIREGNLVEGTIIITDYQYSGRGQRGNQWESQEGENLIFSIILTPAFLRAENNFFLNIAITLGVYDALAKLSIGSIRIKWPNDIYYMNSKLGGILIENTVQSGIVENSVVGIGINVNQKEFKSMKAVSIYQVFNKETDRTELFNIIIHGIDKRYCQLIDQRNDELKQDYLSVLYRLNEVHRFRSLDEFTGRITGIDEYGRLQVESHGKVKQYDLKEIEFLDE